MQVGPGVECPVPDLFGKPARISREAPVLILEHDATETLPGGAGNAANNAAALGAEVALVGVAGDPRSERDGASRRMIKRFDRGVNLSGVVRPRGCEIPVKTRILAGGVHSAKQQIVHVNGLTYDFLYGIAKELEESQSLMLLGAGAKGNEPLVLTRGGQQYRGFLEGRTQGDKYCLLLHLSNMELKAAPKQAAAVE